MGKGNGHTGAAHQRCEPTSAEHLETATEKSMPDIFGTLDISAMLRNESKKPTSPSRSVRWPGLGKVSITTREQRRQYYLWNLQRARRGARLVSSSLRLVRASQTSVEPSFKPPMSTATDARWKEMSQKYTNHWDLRATTASSMTLSYSIRSVRPFQTTANSGLRRAYH